MRQLISSLAIAVAACSAGVLTAEDFKAPGIAVGEKAPDFALPDQTGQTQRLSDLLKKGQVAVVFYRSAAW